MVELKDPIRGLFFQKQEENEKAGGGHPVRKIGNAPNFARVFDSTLSALREVAKTQPSLSEYLKVYLTPKDYVRRIKEFMGALRCVEMADTHFAELKDAVPDLITESDMIAVWTSGHPNYQNAKIEKSGIQQILERAESEQPAGRLSIVQDPIISRDKIAEIPNFLKKVVSKYPGKQIMLVVYDDSESAFKKVEGKVLQFEAETGNEVIRSFVWACTGRVGDSYSVDKKKAKIDQLAQQGIATASSMIDLTRIIKEKKAVNPQAIIASLLDYDGAISDNRIMKLRQGDVFDEFLLKIIEDIILKNRGGQVGKELKNCVKVWKKLL